MRALLSRAQMFAIAAVFSLLACVDRGDPTDPGTHVGPTSVVATVAVRLPVASLEVGHVATAEATAVDASGDEVSGAAVQWSSSDTSVFTVTSTGQRSEHNAGTATVTARKMGTASLYATSDSSAGATTITVTDSVPARILISPAAVSVAVGGQVQMTASVSTATGRALPGHGIRWTSTDTRLATVSSSGLVVGTATGSARIIGAASGFADTAALNVASAAISALSVTPATSSIASGSTVQFAAHATDADGNTLTGRPVAWSSSDTHIAPVTGSGLVTGGVAGTATITATAEGKTATATIVTAPGALKNIAVVPGSISLAVGATQQLSATLTDAAGNTLPSQAVTWSTSNSSIATVSSSGLVSAQRAGNATIAAAASGISGSATLAVSATSGAPTLNSLTLSPSTVTLTPSATKQFSVAGSWSDGSSSVPTVSYSATGGTITAGGLYTAGTQQGTFRVIATQQGGTRADTSAVTVASPPPTLIRLSISPKTSTLVPSGVTRFTVSATWSDGSTTVPTAAFVATGGTITPGGSYTAGTTAGTFRVVATQQGGTNADTAAVTITPTTPPPPPPTVDYRAVATGIRPRGFGQGTYSLVAPASGGREWYVATNGNDADAGTSDAPLRTIAKAAQLAHAGDVVTIGNGTYSGSVAVRNSGTSSAPIVFQAAQRGGVVLSDGNASFGPYNWTGGTQETGQLYVTLRGLIFRRYAANVLASPGPNFPAAVRAARGWRIEDCLLDDAGNTGIQIEGSYVAVIKTTVQYTYLEALSAWAPSPNATGPSDAANYHPLDGIQLIDVVLRGNYALNVSQPAGTADYVAKFLNTRGTMIDNMESYANNGPGFWFDTQNSNFIIQNSYFHDNKNIAGTTGTGRGLHIEVNWAPGLVLHNVFANNDRIGLAITNSQGVTVKENMFYADARCVELTNTDRGSTFPLQNIAMIGNQCALWTDFAGIMTVGDFTNPAAMNIQADNNVYQPGSVNRLAWWENRVIGAAYTITDLRQNYGWEQHGSTGQVSFP
jgi:hypothetical protein